MTGTDAPEKSGASRFDTVELKMNAKMNHSWTRETNYHIKNIY